MRSPPQRTVNACARNVRQIKVALDNGKLAPENIEVIMVALGFSSERAGPDLAGIEKLKKLKKWIKSIIDLLTKN